MTDGSGTTSYAYGPVGQPGALRLVAITTPFATMSYGYDPAGQLTTMAVAGSSERFGYDALGRLATTSNALGTFRYEYLGEANAPAAIHLQGLLRPLATSIAMPPSARIDGWLPSSIPGWPGAIAMRAPLTPSSP